MAGNPQGANLEGAKLDAEGIQTAKATGAINVPEPVVVVKKTPKWPNYFLLKGYLVANDFASIVAISKPSTGPMLNLLMFLQHQSNQLPDKASMLTDTNMNLIYW
tara:strand:+ start:160 stop:474 length:315 start_codon:yes stop_codon:yes gene_type:complete